MNGSQSLYSVSTENFLILCIFTLDIHLLKRSISLYHIPSLLWCHNNLKHLEIYTSYKITGIQKLLINAGAILESIALIYAIKYYSSKKETEARQSSFVYVPWAPITINDVILSLRWYF